jgi:hypothetical protein
MSGRGGVTIDELRLADQPERWRELGFAVDGEDCLIGAVRLRLLGEGAGRGIVGWSLRALSSTDLDGIPTARSSQPEREPAAGQPNGVIAIDHVVVFSPQLDRTVSALRAGGLELRRVREEPTPAGAPRQAFFRLGAEILEVIQMPPAAVERAGGDARPARLWGLAFVVGDLDAAVDRLAPHAGAPHAAVQAGRRIATLRRSAGLAIPVALMTRATAAV